METLDITQIVEAAFTLILALVGAYYTHVRKKSSDADQLDRWVHYAVRAAEQAYKIGMTDDRKSYALQVLTDKGLSIDWGTIDNMIEAAVNELPPVQRTATSESMMDGRGD